MSTEFRAVLFDFGGVFTDSPFHAVNAYAKRIGASGEQVTAVVFGGYGDDGDHPWHQVERGEITLAAARDRILDLGREQGMAIDIWDVFAAMAENGVRKPNPSIFATALERIGATADQAVFLDDFQGNVAAARALGLRSILVDGGGDQTIADLDAILQLR